MFSIMVLQEFYKLYNKQKDNVIFLPFIDICYIKLNIAHLYGLKKYE